jgi:hypothetical protein
MLVVVVTSEREREERLPSLLCMGGTKDYGTEVLYEALAPVSRSSGLVERVWLPYVKCPSGLLFRLVTTSSFYRPRWGSPAGSFLKKELLHYGKTECFTLVRSCCQYASWSPDRPCSCSLWRTTWAVWIPSTIITVSAPHWPLASVA